MDSTLLQATDTLFDLEYWLYKQKVIQGISRDSISNRC